MSVEVTCKKCGKQLRAGDKYAGWRVECPQCKAMNQFPAMAEPLPETSEVPPSKPTAAAVPTPQAKPIPTPSGATGPKPVTPAAPKAPVTAAPPPTKATSEVCGLCAKDFSEDPNRVQDPQGHLFHRACYEREQARRQTAKRCVLCQRPVFLNDMIQDTEGKAFHRRCYDRERARRLAATVRQQPAPSRPTEAKPPASRAPRQPAQPRPPSSPTPSPEEELVDSSLLTPLPAEPGAEEEIIDGSLLLPLSGPAESVVPANDLWGDLTPGLGEQTDGAFGGAAFYEHPAKLSQGMVVLIWVGAAMPVLAILAMVIYSLTRPTSAPPSPAPNVPQSSAAPGTPSVAPASTPQSLAPIAAPNPATSQVSQPPNQPPPLVEARRGFQTKLVRRESAREPVAEPPPNLFRIVRYQSPAGQLAAYLSADPRDGKRHPAIIWITGGDCNTIGDSAWQAAPASNDQSASAFRNAGILMMFPSLRGGNDNPGYKEGFYGEVDDVLAAVDYLAKQDFIDPGRIYLGGHSTGGTLVLLVAASSDRLRAVFSFGPVENVGGYGNEFLFFDRFNPRELELRAPIHWLHSVRSPTFVFEGMQEPGNFSSLQALARASNNPLLRCHAVPGRDHFSILAPTTRLIAEKIVRDSGPTTNITFSQEFGQLPGGTPATARLTNPSGNSTGALPPPIVTPPSPTFPRPVYTPPPTTRAAKRARLLDGLSTGMAWGMGIGALLGVVLWAAILRWACAICSVRQPGFGKAMIMYVPIWALNTGAGLVLDSLFGSLPGALLSLPAAFLLQSIACAIALKIPFGKSMSVTFVVYGITLGIGVCLGLVALAIIVVMRLAIH